MSAEQNTPADDHQIIEREVAALSGINAAAELPAEGADAATGAEATPLTQEDELERLRTAVEAMRRQVEEQRDKALRAQAEMDNLRKRTLRDVENAHKFALEKFVRDLLPVVDSLELGLSVGPDQTDIQGLREGMTLTLQKFTDTLQKFGIVAMDPQAEKFNPERHEAVTTQPAEGVESGVITLVMQKGYELNGRLVRPAMVVVAR
ncbi:MAG: nucleotide exchange factor GrpE [Gammaproteobacteria bacterium]|nr:MAG: nucleotide exchange factor GrpE [Gammaproteobacteria bacterium]